MDCGFPPLSSEYFGESDDSDNDKKLLNRFLDYIETELSSIQPAIQLPERQSSFSNTLKVWAESLETDKTSGKLFIILEQFEEYLLKHTSKRNLSILIEY